MRFGMIGQWECTMLGIELVNSDEHAQEKAYFLSKKETPT